VAPVVCSSVLLCLACAQMAIRVLGILSTSTCSVPIHSVQCVSLDLPQQTQASSPYLMSSASMLRSSRRSMSRPKCLLDVLQYCIHQLARYSQETNMSSIHDPYRMRGPLRCAAVKGLLLSSASNSALNVFSPRVRKSPGSSSGGSSRM
jgi:hypothetical protein